MEEKYNKILKEIEVVLQEEDLMGLIKMGAPSDEYSSESLMVFERVNRYDTLDQIIDKIWDVFYLQFCYGSVCKMVNGKPKEISKRVIPKSEAPKTIGNRNKYAKAAERIKKIFEP